MKWMAAVAAGCLAVAAFGMGTCRGEEAVKGKFVVTAVANPEYRGNEMFFATENYYSPRMKQLREKYGIDAAVAGKTDEWDRILALRHWIKTTMPINNEHPMATRGDAFGILDGARAGGGFHCAHFSIVEHAVMNSYGYVTRRMGTGPGTKERGGHHGVNEVWVNKFSKWVLVDAKYDLHFEKNGVPLSALEIRDEVWKDEAKSVVKCFGPEKGPVGGTGTDEPFGPTADTYRWLSWETSTNHFTAFPAPSGSTLIMYDDAIFRNNVWLRDGKPHWAYNTPFLIKCPNRGWIEWTPNVIASKVSVAGESAHVELTSYTPNLRSYQMQGKDGSWTDCADRLDLPLARETNRFVFRTQNLFGVTGPEHRVEVAWQAE